MSLSLSGGVIVWKRRQWRKVKSAERRRWEKKYLEVEEWERGMVWKGEGEGEMGDKKV